MSVARAVLEGKSREQLLELARTYHWWHAIDLGGLTTSGTRGSLIDAAFARIDFRGKKVLDIGCWDGLWSFEAEKRGARWFRGDPTNWWIPSSACLREWLDCSFFDVASEISFNRDLAGAPPQPPLPGEHAEDRCALIATATSVSGRLARQVKRHALPALPSSPGITKAAIARLCAAASAFHQRQPWLHVPDVRSVKVPLAALPTPAFAVVLGHGGLNRGLAIYYDQAIFTMTSQGSLFDERFTWAAFFALVFVEGRELPAGEEQALREAGWTAGEYPYAVFCTGGTNEKDAGHTLRRPEAGELQLMEACLRALPEFIEKHSAAGEPPVELVSVPISSGEVRFKLCRVAEGEREP